ncbi:MAG: flagellar type III secretion system pore protein FliP [Phycisphaerae bacterium]|nr:flagellar type III secretion system pore protein FliP [Phycisphaerae bacterium]
MTLNRLQLVVVLGILAWPAMCVNAQDAGGPAETDSVVEGAGGSGSLLENIDSEKVVENLIKPDKLSASLEIMLLITVLSLAPAILVMTTCFTRIVVVLALLRQAIGTQQLPPSQVITGLALFMTLLVMAPTWQVINKNAIQPYVNPAEGVAPISAGESWTRTQGHMRQFMITQIENAGNSEGVYMFASFDSPDPTVQEKIREGTLKWKDVSLTALIPAFMTSELKQAFLMGFYIYLPFLVIDMVIASILMSMGMMMLPPVLISLPFKLLLFVLVDGWYLVVSSLLASFTNNVAF